MSELPSTSQDALRPFALFALEARMADGARLVCRGSDGQELAELTADDFRNAYAYYAVHDPTSVKALEFSGVEISDRWKKYISSEPEAPKPRVTLWLWVFFILGVLAGAGGS